MVSKLAEHGNVDNSLAFFLRYNIPQEHIILDVGTRFGSLPAQLHAAGWHNVNGIDINAAAIEEGKKHYEHLREKIQHYDGNVIPGEAGSIDVVTMFDVIEHIPKIEQFLLEVKRVLRPGGIFVFQTPNRYVNILWEILHKRSLTKWRDYHCSLQTKNSLQALLRNAGFTDIQIVKYPIDTEYNRRKVRKALGCIGVWILRCASVFPLWLYPNLYGSARSLQENCHRHAE